MDLVEAVPSSTRRAWHTRSGSIACVPSLDFRRSLAFLRGFGPMAGEQAIDGGTLAKALVHQGQAVLVRVHQPRAGELAYELASERRIEPATEAAVARQVAFFLGAEDDLVPFLRLAEQDEAFGPVALRLAGLHHVKFPSPFEAACWGAINQRIQLGIAKSMKASLCRRFGGRIVSGGHEHLAFPQADTLVRAGEDAVRVAIGNARKAAVVSGLARAFAKVDERFLRDAPIEDVEAWLRAIHGVGTFTSGFVMFRGLGRFLRPAIAPKLLLAAQAVYGPELTVSDLERLSARYGAWGGHWALYLWASSMRA